jgi:putative transposase
VIEPAFAELAPLVHTKRACVLLGKPRATHYRRRRPRPYPPARPRPSPPNALSPTERQQVLDVLHEPRFCDLPPAQVWARLLDHGVYLASISTMYRLLRAHGESRDRRRQRTHPARVKPQLVATRPNDVCVELGYRAPRGARQPRGGARPSPSGCRSSRVKLGAA